MDDAAEEAALLVVQLALGCGLLPELLHGLTAKQTAWQLQATLLWLLAEAVEQHTSRHAGHDAQPAAAAEGCMLCEAAGMGSLDCSLRSLVEAARSHAQAVSHAPVRAPALQAALAVCSLAVAPIPHLLSTVMLTSYATGAQESGGDRRRRPACMRACWPGRSLPPRAAAGHSGSSGPYCAAPPWTGVCAAAGPQRH